MLFQQTCKCDIPSSSKKKKKNDVETGNCHRANVSGCLLFIAFEFVHSHTHLLGTGASQWGGGIMIFICTLNNNVWWKRKADAHGVHLVARWTRWSFSLPVAVHIQARKDSHKACSSLWPVWKTDEAMVLGLGAPGSLQGPHDWAGILGLDHSWHATAESTGMK